ncbi:MAG TPA: hypothetical protein VFY82_11070 [Acidimicrobiales bacterium]|nr:hypothetical protein [Acidimicrobiales bacterium]
MRRVRPVRRAEADLVPRPPLGALDAVCGGGPPGLAPPDQVDELTDLWRRGLLTRALFEHQRNLVLEAWARRD